MASIYGSDSANSILGADDADTDSVLIAQERVRINAELRRLEKHHAEVTNPNLDLSDLDNFAQVESWDLAWFQVRQALNEWLEKARVAWPPATKMNVVLLEKVCTHAELVRERLDKIPYVREPTDTKELVDTTRNDIVVKNVPLSLRRERLASEKKEGPQRNIVRKTRNNEYFASPVPSHSGSYCVDRNGETTTVVNLTTPRKTPRDEGEGEVSEESGAMASSKVADHDASDVDDDDDDDDDDDEDDDIDAVIPADILALEKEAEEERERQRLQEEETADLKHKIDHALKTIAQKDKEEQRENDRKKAQKQKAFDAKMEKKRASLTATVKVLRHRPTRSLLSWMRKGAS